VDLSEIETDGHGRNVDVIANFVMEPAARSDFAVVFAVANDRLDRYTAALGGDLPISITIISPPANGTISTQVGKAPWTFPNAGVTRISSVTNVFYQSVPGYVGQDSFTYKRTSPDPNDPLNANSYTVTIYVKPAVSAQHAVDAQGPPQ
jgi:hypothetical protein